VLLVGMRIMWSPLCVSYRRTGSMDRSLRTSLLSGIPDTSRTTGSLSRSASSARSALGAIAVASHRAEEPNVLTGVQQHCGGGVRGHYTRSNGRHQRLHAPR